MTGDPELPPEESVAIVESICRDPGNSEILRFLCEQRGNGNLSARALPTNGDPPLTIEEAWKSFCGSSDATLSSCIGSVMSML